MLISNFHSRLKMSGTCRWARVMLVGGDADGTVKEELVHFEEDMTRRLYTRP